MSQQTMERMNQQTVESCTVWLNDTERIASFHIIIGYRQEVFNCRDFFWKYVQALQESGYRFQ